MIYVDELVIYPGAKKPFKNGSCHLFSDKEDNGELIDFAESIALKANWIHRSKVFDHFDLTKFKRDAAIKKGANPVTFTQMLKIKGK